MEREWHTRAWLKEGDEPGFLLQLPGGALGLDFAGQRVAILHVLDPPHGAKGTREIVREWVLPFADLLLEDELVHEHLPLHDFSGFLVVVHADY